MMPTSCPPVPTPQHQPRCLVSPLWLFLFIALAVFLQDQLSKNSITTFLKINSGGDQVDPHRPCIIQNSHFWSIYINGRIFQWSTYQKNKNNIATSYTTYRTKKKLSHIYVCISAHIYINMPPDINFEIFLYYYMRIPSPMSSHIIAAADAWCV